MAEHAPRIDAPGDDGLTALLARHAAAAEYRTLPGNVRAVARHCLLDWLGVALAGSADPAGAPLLELMRDAGGAAQATVVGEGMRTSAISAARLNGTFSHALDYDDVSFAMIGHPTVPVMSAVLALAERIGAAGSQALTAFVAGVDIECRIGRYLTSDHYQLGFHATGTVGTFGAAAACGRLLGLDPERMALALGIAGTHAAGLKSMFGTACKPLHAGNAAANGMQAALLAEAGFTSRADVLECEQGFAETHAGARDVEAALAEPGEYPWLRSVLFKYHAACYGTHATINAAAAIRERHAPVPEAIERIEVRVPTENLRMCNIAEPGTGLEAKFSLRHTAAMALTGTSTAAIDAYTARSCADPALAGLRHRTHVVGDAALAHATSEVLVHLRDGTVLREPGDASEPERDLARQESRLVEKFEAIAVPVVGAEQAARLVEQVDGIEDSPDVGRLMGLAVRI